MLLLTPTIAALQLYPNPPLKPQVTKKRTKTAQQPAKATSVAVTKKNGRRVLKSVAKEVAGYRPDLKVSGTGKSHGGVCREGRQPS